MEQQKLEAQVREGDHAKRILEDPLVNEVLQSMRETIYHNISTSRFDATDEREELYKQLVAVKAFEREFTKRINQGKVARTRLEQLINYLTR